VVINASFFNFLTKYEIGRVKMHQRNVFTCHVYSGKPAIKVQ